MYLIRCERSRLCWVGTSSSSSAGCFSCLVVRPPHRCRRRHPRDICPAEASSPSSLGRGLVIRPPHRHRRPRAVCPAEATSSLLSGGPRLPSPTSSSSSSAGHLPCKGFVAVVVRWGSRRLSPTVVIVIVVGHPPRRRLRATCPAKAASPSLSGGGQSSVFHRCHRYRRQPPPTSSSSSSSAGHLSCGGLVAVVVRWGLLPPRRSSLTVLASSVSGRRRWNDVPARCGEQQPPR